MPETRIEPALTAEEWKDALAHRGLALRMMGVPDGAVLTNAHRRAALALYQQPFGFTREDVALLRDWRAGAIGPHHAEWTASLIDRLAALLPP